MKKSSASRRTFWWTAFIVLVAVCAMDSAIWASLAKIERIISPLVTSAPGMPEVTGAINSFQTLENRFLLFGMPGSFIFFLLLLGAIRLVYRTGNSSGKISDVGISVHPSPRKPAKDDAENKLREQRLFLHFISLLQREGRLIDFFAEDLESYDDSQIGAAVRGIHGTCRRVVEKNLALQPVIPQVEGENVVINPGFDPNAIKLVGNVTGDPPFSGVLKHRGWRAGKLEMPTFSGEKDPLILAAAEVEIE